MSEVESFFQDQSQQAKVGLAAAQDDDPETVARSLNLSESTGVPATAISGDLEGFERQHKAALGSDIVSNNVHIADYLNSHPLAPRLSHDDLGQLDIASQAMSKLPEKSGLQRVHEALKIGSLAEKAFPGDPLGPYKEFGLSRPQDIEFAARNPEFAAVTTGLTSLVGYPFIFAGQILGGATHLVDEFAGREAASMLEYGLMRGDLRSPGTGNLGDFEAIGQSMKAAAPWLRAGKGAPSGVNPTIDKLKADQAKADSDVLADALSESVKSATRERNADFYANFARMHFGDREIGIPADAIRDIYGNKTPTPEDGVLGWVPDIEAKLTSAEATGGDIKVPLADWLAKVEPDIAKELKDHIRARPDGITVEEGKLATESEAVSETVPLVRGSASLEPMFSVGDRKVKLERFGARPDENIGQDPKELASRDGLNWNDITSYERQRYIDASNGQQGFHDFQLQDETGKTIGSINISEQQGGKQLYVDMIQAGKNAKMYDPNFLGPALIRDLFRQLKQEFPNAESITGHRVSGAREKADSYMKPSASPVIKFEDVLGPKGWDFIEGSRQIFKDSEFKPLSDNLEAAYKPTDLLTEHEHELSQAIGDELARLTPKQVDVSTPSQIRRPSDKSQPRGAYIQYTDRNPFIIVALDSDNPIGTARHEAVHHLRQQGFFTNDEWSTLSRAARDEGWVQKFNIESRYEGLPESAKLEEAIADGFRNWRDGKETNPKLHPIFERIKELFDSIKAKMKEIFGKELTWDELFQKVDKGEIGSREGKAPTHPDAFRSSLDQGDIPDIGGKEAEKLRERISELRGELSVAKSTGQEADTAKQSELKELRERLRSTTSGVFGMTVEQYKRYTDLMVKRHSEDFAFAKKLYEEQQRKTQTREWKANRTEMRDQVREELEGDPNLAMDQLMTSEKVKFHPDSLSDEQKAMLPKEYIQKKNGLNPDDVAGYFGYASGDALVERLALTTHDRTQAGMSSREWLNHLIDSETDRRMEQRFGNLDQKILEEAKDQAISATQLDLLHEEVLYLGLKAGSEFPISKSQLRQWNKEIFDKTPIASISTDEYLRAAGKAGKAAEMSLLEEDFANAFREKQRQNNAMNMANYAKGYEKARRSFDRVAKTFQKREVPSVGQEWTNWVHDILQRTGNRVNRSVQDLEENINRQSEKTLTEFVEAKEAETFGLRETPVADFLLEPSFRSEMGKLTAEQFYGLKQSIDVLAKQGRDEKKIIIAGEAADREVVLRKMRDKLGTFPEKPSQGERGAIYKSMNLPRMFMAGMTNIETLLNRWDRGDPRGIFNRYLSYPLAKASNHKSSLEREYAKAYGDLGPIKDSNKSVEAPFADPDTRSESNPEGRPWPGFTRKNVLAMLQNAGNKSNWKVLARGYSTDPEALMQWLHRNTTKEDWDRAQKMGDTVFHSLVQKSDVVYENLTGATIEKIPLEPIDTPFGQYKGWYHPLIADPLRKEVWVKNEDTGTWKRNPTGKRGSVMDDSDYFHASTANGYTKRRTGAVYPLDLNFDVVPSRIKQMIHDISFRQTIVEAEKIFGNKAFQTEVRKHYGEVYSDLLMPYLKSMAGAESIPSKSGAKWAQVSEYLRQNTISTYIGFNPFTALKHGPTAAIMSSREVGTVNFLSAVKSLYGQSPELGKSNSEFAMKHSEELQRRERHWQDTIAGEHKEIEGASTLREKVIEKGSWLVAQSDMLSAKPTWIASYNKNIAEGLSHGEAIDLADRSVRRAHGSTAQTNQPSAVRAGGALHGWLTSVYGFFGTAMQRRIEVAHTLNDTYQLGKQGEIAAAAANIPKLTADMFTYVVWPTLVEEWVTGLNTDDKQGWGTHLVAGAFLGLSSSVLYLRDLMHAFTTGHDPGVGLLSSPLHDMANVVRDIKHGKEAFNRQHAGKTVSDALTVFGEGTGMAPKAIANATRFSIDLVNKQQHPKTASEYFRGFTRGTAKKREEK